MELNKFYVQQHSDLDIYILPLRQLKNGGLYGLTFHAWHGGRYGGKAKKGSLRNIHPEPMPIPENCIPDRIRAKFP